MIRITAVILVIFIFCGCTENETVDTSAPVVSDIPTANPEKTAPPLEIEPSPEEQQSDNLSQDSTGLDSGVNLPDNKWEFAEPEDHGVDSAVLDSLHDAVKDIEMYSVVIAKDGYIIDEYYKEGYDEFSVFRLNSCTKSVTSALIGIAIDKGFIEGVDTELSVFFPELSSLDGKKDITIAHLLEHTSGIYWPESGGDMFHRFVESENWVEFVLSQPMSSKPGSTFSYSTGGSHLLSAIIENATGQTMHDFALEYLLNPLGMDSVKWNTDPQGITDGGNGISMNARDAAKFGQLYLNGGKWKDTQVISEFWVSESTRQQSPAQPIPGYGYQWWIRKFGDIKAYYAVGHAGQYIVVVPELELVAVSTGRFPSGNYPFLNYFRDYVLKACGH